MKRLVFTSLLFVLYFIPAFCQIPEYTINENGTISFVKVVHTNDGATQKDLFQRVISYMKKNPNNFSSISENDENYSFSSPFTSMIKENHLDIGQNISWLCFYRGVLSIECRDGRAKISALFSTMKPQLLLPRPIQPYAKHNVECKIVERYPFTKSGEEPKDLEEKVYGASWNCFLSDVQSVFEYFEKALLDNTDKSSEEDW